MNTLISGSTGFIGSALVRHLEAQSEAVTRLVRQSGRYSQRQVTWDPLNGSVDLASLEGTQAVVHLSGASIAGGRWTAKRKALLLESRVQPTRFLAETIARLDPKPEVMVCASAFGYYGSRGDENLVEGSAHGRDFLAGLTRQWEAAADAANHAGIRVVHLRFGLVFDPSGGALKQMLPAFKLGLGGKFGSGRQYISWITLEDVVRVIHHAVTTESLSGPVNTAAPGAVTNAEFTKTLGRVLSRPTLLGIPAFALKIIFGELSETFLSSGRVDPGKLISSGFEFRSPDLEPALRQMFGKTG